MSTGCGDHLALTTNTSSGQCSGKRTRPDSTRGDYKDLVIAHLVGDEVVLRDRLVEALAAATGYRTLSQQAIQALHDLTRHLERTRQAHGRTCDEYREFRARLMHEEAREAV